MFLGLEVDYSLPNECLMPYGECLSDLRTELFFAELVTVLVTDGARIEVIKESGNTKVCPYRWNYPLEISKAAGAFLPDKTFLVCGGFGWDGYQYDSRSDCYKLKDGAWEKLSNLLTGRANHASSPIEKGKGKGII